MIWLNICNEFCLKSLFERNSCGTHRGNRNEKLSGESKNNLNRLGAILVEITVGNYWPHSVMRR